jgi:CDP-diacylglycerol--glycerol-3-phosphate 3-phosphatidyltransferase
MTLASKITVGRLALVPVFAYYAIYYGHSNRDGHPDERLRWIALTIFIVASASDALDGWVARRFNQRSKFGAFMDPLADKFLLLTGIMALSVVDWGPPGWRIPIWFSSLVVARDCLIIFGLWYLHGTHHKIRFAPHWSGKFSTVTQMIAIGWVMLKLIPFSPVYPATVAAVFTIWSAVTYVRQGLGILRESGSSGPATTP